METLAPSYPVWRGAWYVKTTGCVSHFRTVQHSKGKETVSQKGWCFCWFYRFFYLGSHRPWWARYFLLLYVCRILTQRTSHLNRREVEGAKGTEQNGGQASCKLQAVDRSLYQLSQQLVYVVFFVLFAYWQIQAAGYRPCSECTGWEFKIGGSFELWTFAWDI